ncbi:MAG: glycosyltransferase family 2 protein [Candidatus Handelsmanbacteria bacterium]|nr:glycosyltransferase family 2 protein [Candidatus Handelsmanbacteria bacterium]
MGAQVRPALSVVIVNWNTRQLLRDCLEAVLADPASGQWEVWVVDNASADGSPQMVREDFPQVKLLVSPQNLGFSRGNNLALERAEGEYLLLLNSDTRVEPGALGGLVDFMATHPRIGAAGPMLLNADGSLQLSCGVAPSLRSEIVHKLLLHRLFPFFKLAGWDHRSPRAVGWVSGACLLVRRQALEEVGPLDPAIYMCCEDLEWCLRLTKRGWQVYYYPFSRVVHLEGQSIGKNLGEMLVVSQQSLFYLFQKHFGRGALLFLRLLTLVEMGLRSAAWSAFTLCFPARRAEGLQRLRAYRQILGRSLFDRAYWSPMSIPKDKGGSEN